MVSIKSLIIVPILFVYVASSQATTTTTFTDTITTQITTTETITTTTTTNNGPQNPYGTFIYNPRTLMWHAYAPDGALVKSGRGSGGANYCRDVNRGCRTAVGVFRVYAKGNASCKSSKFPLGRGGAPMPWCMFFRGGFAIHGSYEVRNYNASHGCLRVYPADAAWLSHNLIRVGTVVIIKPY
jgi:hypothetical protein